MQTVFTYETDTQKLLVKRTEIYRYLGYKTGMTINCEMEDMIEEILQNVLKGSSAKVCYKRFSIVIDEEIDFGFMRVKSKELKANLKDCNEVVIFAATIGLYTDRQIFIYELKKSVYAFTCFCADLHRVFNIKENLRFIKLIALIKHVYNRRILTTELLKQILCNLHMHLCFRRACVAYI